MKKLNEVSTTELATKMGWSLSYASQVKKGITKISGKVALTINDRFGIPLWEIRPDIYPKRIFNSKINAINPTKTTDKQEKI